MIEQKNSENPVVVYSKSYCPFSNQVQLCNSTGTHVVILTYIKECCTIMGVLQVKSFFKESGVDFKAFELDQIGKHALSKHCCLVLRPC